MINLETLQETMEMPATLLRAMFFRILSLSVLAAMTAAAGCSTAPAKGTAYPSPDGAARAFVDALRADDLAELEKILGSGAKDLLDSGDPVSDAAERRLFVERYDEKSRIEPVTPEKAVLHVGDLDWPFPIPIVKVEEGWAYDIDEGIEEILNRRIGKNELAAIQVCLAIADAQREYFSEDRDGDGRKAFADRFASSPGKMDGLYWKTEEGEPPSPLGFLAAQAAAEGYSRSDEGPTPYHGYFYRILTAQGSRASGGVRSYIVDGAMAGGFALVAYPAEYGASGIMTFMISRDGILFEKDLGEETEKIAREMEEYDPDSTWSTVDPAEPAGTAPAE